MRRIIFAVAMIVMPLISHAISCPNNGKILSLGDPLNQALESCGTPQSTQKRTEKTVTSAKWVYYKPSGTNNTKVTILFNNRQVSNISVYGKPANCQTNTVANNQNTSANPPSCAPEDQNVTVTSACGGTVQVGYSMEAVQSACGTPSENEVLESRETEITELLYTSNGGPNTLVFENGSLTDWKN